MERNKCCEKEWQKDQCPLVKARTIFVLLIICSMLMVLPAITEKADAATIPFMPSITSLTSSGSTVSIGWNYPGNTRGIAIEILDTTNGKTHTCPASDWTYSWYAQKGQTVTVIIRAVTTDPSAYNASNWTSSKSVVVGSGGDQTIGLNVWSSMQYKDHDSKLKYKFTLDYRGLVEPIVYIDTKQAYGDLWNSYITNSGLEKVYSWSEPDNDYVTDSNGHEWEVQRYEKVRLPAGTYYFYFPSDSLSAEYGHFKFKIKYTDESGKNNVEREFNNSRSKANKITFNRMYKGNIAWNDKDIDYYKFKLTKKKTVTVTMYYPETNLNWNPENYCAIYNKSGKKKAKAYTSTYTEDSNGKFWYKIRFKKKLPKGTYYIRIAELDQPEDYKFKITK